MAVVPTISAAAGVSLIELTVDNYQHVVELCVDPDQEKFVGTPAEAIADAYFHPGYVMRAIVTADNTIVGFLMYGLGDQHRVVVLHRLLIHCTQQGKGIGSEALRQLKLHLVRSYGLPLILELVTNSENAAAIAFYRKLGFEMSLTPDGKKQRGILRV
jgi:diamine N-acetyltransferase